MVENKDVIKHALESLVDSARNKNRPLYSNLDSGVEESLEGINKALVDIFRQSGKKEFNDVVEGWVYNFLGANIEKITSDNSLQTVSNYLRFVKDESYFSEETEVTECEGNITIRMNEGCPYSSFCDTTNHKKCVRGSILKTLLHNSYLPTLNKRSYPKCEISIEPLQKAADNFLGSGFMDEDKHIL